MYNLPYFKADNEQEVLRFMHDHPFVTLCGCDANNNPVATHVPVLIEERDGKLYLVGHFMRQTDHHKAFVQNPNALVIFTGAHTYVSASWYADQKQASTWNYLTVHARGTLSFGDEQMLLEVLTKTTAKFEDDASSPSLVKDLPVDYVQRLMKAIVAFEIAVTEIDHVFKLSQNRDKTSYEHIIEKLRQGDEDAQHIAKRMAARHTE